MRTHDFKQENLGKFFADPKREALLAAANEYHQRSEKYDRQVCTGPVVNGSVRPVTAEELKACALNATQLRTEIFTQLKLSYPDLGFQEWLFAVVDAGRSFVYVEHTP